MEGGLNNYRPTTSCAVSIYHHKPPHGAHIDVLDRRVKPHIAPINVSIVDYVLNNKRQLSLTPQHLSKCRRQQLAVDTTKLHNHIILWIC
jgi:hypothetical protein